MNNEASSILSTDPDMQKECFISLLDLLQRLRGDELYITAQLPISVNDDVQEFSWAKSYIEYELAVQFAPFIQNSDLSPIFFRNLKQSLNTVLANAQPIPHQQYPETLPIGSGNEWYGTWNYRFYANHDNVNYDFQSQRNKGEKEFFVADFDSDAVKKGTSVSSVEWRSISSSVLISSESLAINVARALIDFNKSGFAKFKAVATYANGGVHEFNFLIEVASQESNLA